MEGTSAHGRLLYKERTLEYFDSWSVELASIDKILSQSSKFHPAGDDLTFYFFGLEFSQSSPFWIGREVVGFESVLPDGFNTFDSFSGQVFSYDFEGLPSNSQDMFRLALEYASQIPGGDLLASTWCMKLKGIDHGQLVDEQVKTPFTRFLFFKKT